MRRNHNQQSGGIVSFIVVGFVLAALLGGGIILSKQQARVASRADTVAVNKTGADNTATDTAPTDTAPADTSKDNKPVGDGGNQNPQPTTQDPATPPPSRVQDAAPTAPRTGPSAGYDDAVPQTGPSQIAATGSEDALVPTAAVLALMAAGLVSYRRSSSKLRTTALTR